VTASAPLTASAAPTAPAERPTLRLTPSTVALLALAALAWAGVIAYARDMGNGAGSMGIPLAEFTAMWALMMTAMMAPAVAPVASLYARTITSQRAARLALFIVGYLFVWALSGIPAYAVLRLVDHAGGNGNTTMRNIAVGVLAAAGAYQLSPLKARCLRHCRSPLAQLLHYGNVKGRMRDLKVALHHAGYCLGCCWALMALFIAFGVMNLWAMLGLAAVVLGEKVLPRGEAIGRLAGGACVVLAVLVLASPRVANTVVPSMNPGMKSTPMTHM
jgi:predicted metal-binding membrane protein